MRKIVAATAKLGLLGAFVAFTNVSVVTPSFATKVDLQAGCYFADIGPVCPGSRQTGDSSTGQNTSLCNGRPGFWLKVTFANGETECIAQSPADFYHNGSLTQTCTFLPTKGSPGSTSDGACPPPGHF